MENVSHGGDRPSLDTCYQQSNQHIIKILDKSYCIGLVEPAEVSRQSNL